MKSQNLEAHDPNTQSLEIQDNKNYEIERKFLVSELPRLEDFERSLLKQGYISTSPTIRLRSEDDKSFFLTIKGRGHAIHEEYELEISKSQFENLWNKIEGFAIEKIRYRIPLDLALTAELDEYLGRLKGFYTVEVEFSTVEDLQNFTPPGWFGLDVTEDRRYTNSALSKGMPPGFS